MDLKQALKKDKDRFVYAISLNPRDKERVIRLLKQKEIDGEKRKNAMNEFSNYLDKINIKHTLSEPKLIIRKDRKTIVNKSILWVDDHPDNLIHLREYLIGKRGINKIVNAVSTEDAIAILRNSNNFDLIISDLKRGSNRMAGIELLDYLKAINNLNPILIYGGRVGVKKYRKLAKSKGAIAVTSDSLKLIEEIENFFNS